MGNWVGVVTNAGAELLNAWAGGSSLSVYAATAGTGTVAAASLAAQTALANQKQTVSIVSKSIADDADGLKIQVQITAPTAGYTLNQIGLWAKVDNGAGKLLALYQNTDGISVPAASTSSDFAYTFYGYLTVSNAASISVTIDTSATATMSAVQAAIVEATAELRPIIATTAPTITTAGAVGQAYIDTATSRIWRCTAASSGAYTWEPLLNVLTGAAAPTITTAGMVGQKYINTKTTDVYICKKASPDTGTYVWAEIITSGNIGAQYVGYADVAQNAYYARNPIGLTTHGLRNEYFIAKDEYDSTKHAPTAEGEICWLYG